jgi:uncharacterized membrane protein YfcA
LNNSKKYLITFTEIMTNSTLLILLSIGLGAGILSGFVGIGGGVVIVPALVFLLGLSQHEAQGTSLFVLVMPVVFLALTNYWKTGNVNWKYGIIIAIAFIIGGFFGSKLSLKLSPQIVKLAFGLLMAYVSFQLIFSSIQEIKAK